MSEQVAKQIQDLVESMFAKQNFPTNYWESRSIAISRIHEAVDLYSEERFSRSYNIITSFDSRNLFIRLEKSGNIICQWKVKLGTQNDSKNKKY